jgi:hypothetical protein
VGEFQHWNVGWWHDHYFYHQTDFLRYGLRRFMPEYVSVDSIWSATAREGRPVALIDIPKSQLENLLQTLHVSFWGEHEVMRSLVCWQ